MEESPQFDIEELAGLLDLRKVNDQPTVLLLGARAGGLFRNRRIYDNLERFSHRDFRTLSRIEQFSECYTILTRRQFSETDIHSILRTAVRDLAVTRTDVYLAELIKQRYFDEIISTNIDDVLERSVLQAGMQEHRDFEVTIPVRATLYDKNLPHRILKIFGDFGSRMYIVKERFSQLDNNPEVKNALQRILARDVIVVGLDPKWDEDIMRVIPPKSGSLFFVNEEKFDEQSMHYSILKARKAQYIRGSYDSFMRELYSFLYGSLDLPSNYQLLEILAQLSDIANRLQVVQDEQKSIIGEIEKIKNSKGN
jgi:ssDNA-specific exonuclease RecJ